MNQTVYCCVDVGGTKILLLLIDGDRKVLYRAKSPTPAQASPAVMAGAINDAIRDGLAETGLAEQSLSGIGVCIAALINFDRGEIFQSPNLGWYEPVPFRELLMKNRTCPVFLENDANAAVLGEVAYGAARGHRTAIYITISTGIGGGLYLDGKIYRGSMGFAGEVGHIKPFGKGRKCGCGGLDCLETWASGGAIARNARLLWEEDRPGGGITTAWVFDQAQAGNNLARSIIEHALDDISTGLANLVTLLNPSCLVIGGGVVGNRADFLEQIRVKIKQSAVAPAVKYTPLEVTAAQLEPEAGIWGMYALMVNFKP